ncbi:transmembrane protein, putative (macronuclear) [Tetrahymena thermophila SB210]|uniref:Transmembrane protein, putative n=1 Tax=Tetrahymena thermophila (strain SB210) TaxID=312017 RepID=W7X9J5_TETTS|nr:transmembrane protein, putative [Tetrahymena thermophila SB210]EWS76085.1 transmembrane protein, putative [Tetrahymena thermophila SB210]|eukprot:XP_012651392.1 transmembrane protein, putative [Tetrahymena thermophila SB210]
MTNKILLLLQTILFKLGILILAQAQKCPNFQVQQIPKFFESQYIINYLKIPKTNLLLINSTAKDQNGVAITSVVYYNDISKDVDNTINVIRPDYTIVQMDFIEQTNQILVASEQKLIVANIYTLSIINHLIISNLKGINLIQGTNLAFVTTQTCNIYIIDVIELNQVYFKDSCYFKYDIYNPLYFPKIFFLQNGLIFVAIKDKYGFQAWSLNTTTIALEYHNYLPEPQGNPSSTQYIDIDVDLNWNVIYAVGQGYLINIIQIVNLREGKFKLLKNLQLMDSTSDFYNGKLIRGISQTLNSQSLYLTDTTKIFRLDIQIFGDFQIQKIDSLTYEMAQQPFPISIEAFQHANWYFLEENKVLVLPVHNIFHYGGMEQTYSIFYSYIDNTFQVRQYYRTTGFPKIFHRNFDKKDYYITPITSYVFASEDTPQGKDVWTFNLGSQINGKENCFIEIANYPKGFFLQMNNNNLIQLDAFGDYYSYMDISYLNLSFGRISQTQTSYLDQEKYLWILFALPFKDNNEKFLFWIVDYYHWNLQQLVSNNDADNQIQTCYALYSDKNKLIVGLDVLGNVYGWNSQNITEFKFKKSITKYQCFNSTIGQLYNDDKALYLVAVCDNLNLIAFNIDTEETQLLKQMSSKSFNVNSFEEIQLIGVGESDTGNVFLFTFNQNTQSFEFFLQFQTIKQKDYTLNLQYLAESQMLFIQYFYSIYYFPIGQCLQNRQNCLNCQMDFYFNSTEQQLSNNLYGLGTQESPFVTSKSLITSFLLMQQYNDLIFGVQKINATIYIYPNQSLQIIQELINVQFGNIINLTIKSVDESIQSEINTYDVLEFQQFNILRLQNIMIKYLISSKNLISECGLKITKILDTAYIEHINYKQQLSQQQDQSQQYNQIVTCYFMHIDNSSVILQNINISSANFSHFEDLIIVTNSNQISLQNFTLENSILNSQFSILRQISDTNITINQMFIQNNTCNFEQITYSENVGELFQGGLFNVSNMQIKGNIFCNQKVFSTITNVNQKNYILSFQNITITQNKFYTMASYLFFNAIYTFNPLPQHTLLVNNVQNSENQYFPDDKTYKNLLTTSLIQIDKVQNIILNNITTQNQNKISFLRASNCLNNQLFNISCTNDFSFFQNTDINQYAGCLIFTDVKNFSLNMFNSSFIKAVDQSIINVQSQIYENVTIQMTQINIFNSSFYQTLTNTYSNPIFISSDQYSNIKILDSYFHDNILFGFINSQTQSTTGIQIINSQGDNLIQGTRFNNSKSNALYNFMFVQSKSLLINNCSFQYSSFDLQDTNTLFVQEGGCIRVKTVTLQLLNTFLSQSTSSLASFIYIESQINEINIILSNSSFSQGYSSQDGGAFLIHTQNSNIKLLINKCNFTDIYSLNAGSKAISVFNQAQVQIEASLSINLTAIILTNILGNTDSIFLSVNQSQVNVQGLKAYNQKTQNYPTQFNKKVLTQNLQTSTLIYAEKSNITINNTNFSNLYSSYQSTQPLLIKSINSNISIQKIQISQSFFMPSLIDATLSQVIMSQAHFSNLSLVVEHRNLQQQNIKQQINSNSLIKLNTSSITINDNSYFNEIICLNCQGSSLYLTYTAFNIQNTCFRSSQVLNGGAILIQGITQTNNLILNSNFTSNIATYSGGAIYLKAQQNDIFKIIIHESKFEDNLAVNGYGGAFYIETEDMNSAQQVFIVNKTIIQKNKAFIGGGIYNQGINPQIYQSQIQFNQGQHYGDNQFSYPTELHLVNYYNFSKDYPQKISLNKFKSGDKFPKFIFQLRDTSFKPITFTEGQQLTAKIQISQKTQNYSQYYFRGNTLSNLDPIQNIFIFDQLELVGIPSSDSVIEFVSDSIKVYNNYTLKFENNYTFEVYVNFRNCVYGEIFNQYNNYKECQTCEEGKYSLDFQGCYSCPQGGDCQNGTVQLQNGFWRKEEYSIEIIQCYNRLQNCVKNTEKSFGNNICVTGNIGPLCEECDIHGEFWEQSYTRTNNFQCGLCEDQTKNLFKLVLTYIWILVSIYLTVKSEQNLFLQGTLIKSIRYKQKQSQKQNMLSFDKGRIQISRISNQKQNEVNQPSKNYIKILTNYFQIISSVSTFNLNINSRLVDISSYLGNPIKTSTDFLECLLKEINTHIPLIYLKLIFSLTTPLIILIVFVISLKIKQYLVEKSRRFKLYQFYTGSIFLFLYLQPDLVSQMISLLSCRQIGDTLYILNNTTYECNTKSYKFYSISFVLPFLILWVLILPLLLLIYILKNKVKLDNLSINMRFGFLYREYKNNVFYWEFIKIAQKISIIIVLNFYYQYTLVKGCIVTLIITAYGILANKYQPYEESQYNQIDSLSTKVCALTIFLCVFINGNEYNYLIIISLITVIIINFYFNLVILMKVLEGYKQYFSKICSWVKNKISLKNTSENDKQQGKEKTVKFIKPELKKKIQIALIKYTKLSQIKRYELLLSQQLNTEQRKQIVAQQEKQNNQEFEQTEKSQIKKHYLSPQQSASQLSMSPLSSKISENQSQNILITQNKIDKLVEMEFKLTNFQSKFEQEKSYRTSRKNNQNPFLTCSKIKKIDYEMEEFPQIFESNNLDRLSSTNSQNKIRYQK